LTLRGGANFLVVGPDVATILESIPGYVVSTDGDSAKFAMGVSRVGSFASRFQVYKNPYMQENTILMGFRGNNFLETGAAIFSIHPTRTNSIGITIQSTSPDVGCIDSLC
jgi:hypothetical protein